MLDALADPTKAAILSQFRRVKVGILTWHIEDNVPPSRTVVVRKVPIGKTYRTKVATPTCCARLFLASSVKQRPKGPKARALASPANPETVATSVP